jgi:TonB family protein
MKAEIPAVRNEPELHLVLLDNETVDDRPRWLQAGSGSVAFHVLLIVALIGLAKLPAPAPIARAAEDFKRAISLVAPPQQLTQKDPNRAKVGKELTVENLTAKPEVRPAPRVFMRPPSLPPAPQVPKGQPSIEPPSIIAQSPPPNLGTNPLAPDVVAPPPQIKPAEEKPKLAFETPGAPSGTPAPEGGTGRIPVPRSGIQDAMRGAGRGPTGLTVGDTIADPGSIGQMNQQGSPGRPASSLELLSDPLGVDFKPYLIRILAAVRRNWFAVIPESARLGRRGRTVLQFSIAKDGNVPKLVIVTPSGADALDRAAVAGVSASNPFPPLPAEYKGDQIRVQFVFSYNLPTR